MSQTRRAALTAARNHIAAERALALKSITDCEGHIDPIDQPILDEHDELLRQIDEALAEKPCGMVTAEFLQRAVAEARRDAVPEGYRLVPLAPSDAMLSAGQSAWLADPLRKSSTLYRAMLAAAPQPPGQANTGSCAECGKRSADGWALYCVEHAEQIGEVERKPLDAHEVVAIFRQWDSTPGAGPADLIRMVEVHHGIGASK